MVIFELPIAGIFA